MSAPRLRFKGFSDEWKTGQLRNNFSTISTNSYSRSLLNYHTGDVKNIHYGDIHVKFKSHFKVNSENVPYINDDVKITYREECYCRKGDLIFADASEDLNDIGKSIEIIDTNDEKILAGLHTVHLRSLGNEFATGFGGYLLKTNSLIKQIQREAQGAKVLGISASKILGLTYYSPSIKEQEKIADFLTSVDDKINLLKKKKELLEQYKKGVMQKIFSQELRFKDDEGKDFPEWEEKELGEIATITIGEFVIKTKQNENGKYPVYNGGRSYTGLYDQFNNEGDKIVISARGANAGFVNYVKNRYWAGNSCYSIGILNNEKHNTIFVFYYLKFQEKSFIQNQQAANIPSVSKQETQRFTVKTPIIFEQQKIADFLTALDDKIALVEQQINKTEHWKKGLLQQMFV